MIGIVEPFMLLERVADGYPTSTYCIRLGELDLHVRQGIHSGEVEVSPSDARGIAVHATARIADLAHPAEIWVSGTVRDLLDGSDFDFQERGQHELKGLHGSRALYAIGADPIARESTHSGG